MQTNLQRLQRLFAHPVRYEIPAFQRRYVWTQEEQWEPLWDDVAELSQSLMEAGQTKPHFMGDVYLQQLSYPAGTIERRIVVDGQQRLTTLQLLLDAIREILKSRGYTAQAGRLSALIVNSDDFLSGDADNAFKVWPSAVDRSAFRHAMNDDLVGAEYAKSRIVEARDFFKGQAEQWLDKFAEETGERNMAALALESAVRQNLELVVVDLDDSDNANKIFETLNARRTPLLQSDMVKNKILHDADVEPSDDAAGQSADEKQLWTFDEDWWAQEVGRGLQRRPRIDVFLNHWLTLRNRSETKPYEEFRVFERYAAARSEEGCAIGEVAKDIGHLGRIYREVEEGRRMDIAPFLERRNAMNVGVTTPLLLWLLSSDVPQTTFARCLRALESFLVRRAVCGYSARGYGELFVALLARLAGDMVENADRIVVSYLGERTAQAGLWPDDQEFRDRFANAPLYQWLTRGRLRMVLMGIERQLRTDKTEIQEVPKNLHIEHVMPQAWYSNWPLPNEIADDNEAVIRRDRAIHTIGNLTLVNGRLNASLSNAPWGRKRNTLFQHSVLLLNRKLVYEGPEIWDECAIKGRAEWLYEKAVQIWPHANKFDIA